MIDVTGEVAQIVASVVAAVGIIVVTIITTRTRADARAARAQVENDHDKNFRDDMDGKHVENRAILRQVLQTQITMQRDIAWILRRQIATDDRLEEIEDTMNPRKEDP